MCPCLLLFEPLRGEIDNTNCKAEAGLRKHVFFLKLGLFVRLKHYVHTDLIVSLVWKDERRGAGRGIKKVDMHSAADKLGCDSR